MCDNPFTPRVSVCVCVQGTERLQTQNGGKEGGEKEEEERGKQTRIARGVAKRDGICWGGCEVFLAVMEAILEERITNCGISAAGRRRGALPGQVEHRQDRSEEREAGASPEEQREPGAHPGGRGFAGLGHLPRGGGERQRGRGEPGPGAEGAAGPGAAPGAGARRGQRGQRPQAAGGAAPSSPPPPPPPPVPAIQRATAAIPTG